jgi:hypothetical protein
MESKRMYRCFPGPMMADDGRCTAVWKPQWKRSDIDIHEDMRFSLHLDLRRSMTRRFALSKGENTNVPPSKSVVEGENKLHLWPSP